MNSTRDSKFEAAGHMAGAPPGQFRTSASVPRPDASSSWRNSPSWVAASACILAHPPVHPALRRCGVPTLAPACVPLGSRLRLLRSETILSRGRPAAADPASPVAPSWVRCAQSPAGCRRLPDLRARGITGALARSGTRWAHCAYIHGACRVGVRVRKQGAPAWPCGASPARPQGPVARLVSQQGELHMQLRGSRYVHGYWPRPGPITHLTKTPLKYNIM